MKRLTIVALIAMAVIFVLAACSNANNNAGASPGGASPGGSASVGGSAGGGTANKVSDLTVGYNAGSDSIEFWANVLGGMKYEAAQEGVGFISVVSDFDAQKIIPNTQQLLMQGAQVIVDGNVNNDIGSNIVDVVKQAGGAGTISIDVEYTDANGKDKAWFMGIDNQRAGELCGEALGDALIKQNRTLEYLVLFFNSENGDLVKERMGGAVDGLKAKGITLKDDQIQWIDMGGGGSDTTIQGRDKFSAWLTAHPDVRTVATVAVNDETTQGIYAAAQTANRLQDCLMASHNVSEQFKQLALNGDPGTTWIGSVAYHPENYGQYIIPLAIDIWTGKNTDPTVKTLMSPEWIPMSKDAVTAYNDTYNAVIAKWKQ